MIFRRWNSSYSQCSASREIAIIVFRNVGLGLSCRPTSGHDVPIAALAAFACFKAYRQEAFFSITDAEMP